MGDSRPPRISVRLRLSVTAVGIVAVALAAGAFGLVTILRATLERGVTNTALTRAADVAALAKGGTLPPSLAFPGEERSVIQVVDAHGRVVASTANIAGEAAIVVRSSSPYTATRLPIGDAQRFRITTTPVDTATGPMVVISGEALERVDGTVGVVGGALGAGIPALLILVAGLAWWGTGRALRPVEAIRAEVAEITETDLHRRVPDPAGNDEISHLASTMNAMLDRLETASERQTRFVADASHELRSPLTSLRTQLEIGLARPHRDDWPQRVEGALADVDRLDRLVRDLLVVTRAVNRSVRRVAPCDLVAMVTNVVARCDDARVTLDAPAERPAWVAGDSDELARAIGNLLENAIRHARSAIAVHITERDGDAIIEVVDDGPGIDPLDRQRIFERFVRLDEARAADDGGSGLGLSIVHAIVTAHGGTVSVTGPTPGTTFRVTLPRLAWPDASPDHGTEHH